jgi:hypothetical protein
MEAYFTGFLCVNLFRFLAEITQQWGDTKYQIAEWPTEKIYNLFWFIFRVRGYYFRNKKEDSATNICDLEQRFRALAG